MGILNRSTAATAPPPLPDAPYVGIIDLPDGRPVVRDWRNRGRVDGDLAASPPHVLISAETGGGKTRSLLAPNVLRWGPRPVVAMSSKADLCKLTIARRARFGPIFVMDLSGSLRASELAGVEFTHVSADPCAALASDDDALELADLLLEMGDGSNGASSGDASFWKALARRRLACFLLAGGYYRDPYTGERTWGGGVAWALDACENVGPAATDAPEGTAYVGVGVTAEGLDPDAADVQEDAVAPNAEPRDMVTPDWGVALRRCMAIGSRHAKSLLAARGMDQKQRDSIGMNCQTAMSSWALDIVATGHPAFSPEMLTTKGATLYVIAPSKGAAAAPAAVTLTQITDYWRRRVGEVRTVLYVLDELANAAPVPARVFLSWISEGRGLGIRVAAVVQNTSQFKLVWSAEACEILRNTFPAFLLLTGANEQEVLERAVALTPTEERGTASRTGAQASHARERGAALTVADLNPAEPGYGRLILSGLAGVRVRLPDLDATDLRC